MGFNAFNSNVKYNSISVPSGYIQSDGEVELQPKEFFIFHINTIGQTTRTLDL